MIKEFKLDKKVDARKKHNQPKHKKNHSSKKTKKHTLKHVQKGGNFRKDKFEVTTLDNVDPSKFSISQYVNANIDWGNIMPGPPPTDCSIM